MKTIKQYSQFLKFCSVGLFITLLNYIAGVVFVDLFNIKYYIIGLFMIIINVLLRYFLEIKYVYKKNE
jgi:putative flippase GtrA